MNKSIIIKSKATYTDPVLEGMIISKHEEYIKSAKVWGGTCAIQGTIDNTNLNIVTETIYRNYDHLTNESHRIIDGKLGIAQAKLDIYRLHSENEKLEIVVQQTETVYKIEKHKIGKIIVPKIPFRQLIFATVIGLFILFFDSYYIGTAFQAVGYSLGVSLMIGLSVCLTIAVVSVLGTTQIDKIPNKLKRHLAYCGLIVFIGASVYVLCEMREYYFQAQIGHSIPAFKIMLLNLLAFLGFHLVYKYILTPAIDILKERKEAKQKLAITEKIKQKLNNLRKQISSNLDQIVAIKQFRLSVLSYAKSTENKISKLYRESIAEFKKAYIENTSHVPDCFASETPDLTQYYSNYEITPKIHENSEN